MIPSSRLTRPISEYSDNELELQKAYYRELSRIAIMDIKKSLTDLYHEGVFVHLIRNYEQSPNVSVFPDSIFLWTGCPIKAAGYQVDKIKINIDWDFWRNDVIQHVIESEIV